MYKYSHLPLRSLYELKEFWEQEEKERSNARPEVIDHIRAVIIEYKREIRRRSKKPASNIISVWADGYNWVEVVACPGWVKCAEEAEEFFKEDLDLPPIRSAYDCTGLPFVSWHKVGLRSGRWVVYVSKGLDL